jgi:hypothetical protein
MRRALIAIPIAAVLALGAVAGPAAAATSSGFRSCSVNYVVKLATITSGSTSVAVNSWHDSAVLGTNVAMNWFSDQHGGSWTVTAPTVSAASASCS